MKRNWLIQLMLVFTATLFALSCGGPQAGTQTPKSSKGVAIVFTSFVTAEYGPCG
ncbi:MAG: hypothetical protein P9M14_12275 [Candidatus Alcyoniella australis]|nr:hypothetical protein [Candidatus Alcyoniella australis]